MSINTNNNIKKGQRIVLPTTLVEEANTLGLARHANNRKCGVHLDINNGRNGNVEVQTAGTMQFYDMLGIRAEYAFATLANMDEESWGIIKAIGVQSAASNNDDGDGYLYSNGSRLSVDVKSTYGYRSNMLISFNKLFNKATADIFTLMIEDERNPGSFVFAGAIDRETLEANVRADKYEVRSRHTWWIPARDLLSLDQAVANSMDNAADRYAERRIMELRGN